MYEFDYDTQKSNTVENLFRGKQWLKQEGKQAFKHNWFSGLCVVFQSVHSEL
jgi:hypothetical protein